MLHSSRIHKTNPKTSFLLEAQRWKQNHLTKKLMTLEIHILIIHYNQKIPSSSKQSIFINVQDGEHQLAHLHYIEAENDGKPHGHDLLYAPFYLQASLIRHGLVFYL